ncbi:Phosphoglycerate mutase [Carnobacterium maltaromaticum]|uniref:histidine phosphatase family protein n=1 Tax=Carnobacterium maltaromaticum TaxID=2751 RepID=UPI00191BA1A8|nr:histidine phosphatase family protein [Carnobacterium maltaromaticum]CAD5901659.1 Phosphoglycerate mutase [Carnobacterium maltaromaticum]
MAKLYFVRHGKTEWNLEGRFQGGFGDSALLDEAIEAAKETGKRLSEISFAHVYTSPQKRAKDTAEYIIEENRLNLPLTEVDGLREIGFGDWEGQPFSYAEENHLEAYINLKAHPEKYDPSAFNGETYEELIERSQNVIEKAVAKHPGKDLLFVAHGVTLLTIMHTLLGKETGDIRSKGLLGNTSISILETDGRNGYSVVSWNDTTHLEVK